MTAATVHTAESDLVTPADGRSMFAPELHIVAGLTLPASDEIKSKTVVLGPRTKKHTLILDIDGTLLYAQAKDEDKLEISMRPFVRSMLETLAPLYEIVLFTAGTEDYADLVKQRLDPAGTYIARTLGNSSCVRTKEGYWVKDLRIFADRDLKDLLIVDDNLTSFAFQLDNGVPVASYRGEEEDDELQLLTDYLQELYGEEDIRAANRERLRLSA